MSMTIWQLFVAGGIFMWPILGCSVLALAIIIWQILRARKFRIDANGFFLFLASGGKSGSGAFGGMDKEALLSKGAMRELEIAEEKIQLSFDTMGKPLELLSVLGGIAPLLGFLGTVSGMIGAFQAIAAADKVSVKLVAAGISEAMITTGYGLIVAIPCMLAESGFRFAQSNLANRATEALSEAARAVEKRNSGETEVTGFTALKDDEKA